jgi:hypothetical protein
VGSPDELNYYFEQLKETFEARIADGSKFDKMDVLKALNAETVSLLQKVCNAKDTEHYFGLELGQLWTKLTRKMGLLEKNGQGEKLAEAYDAYAKLVQLQTDLDANLSSDSYPEDYNTLMSNIKDFMKHVDNLLLVGPDQGSHNLAGLWIELAEKIELLYNLNGQSEEIIAVYASYKELIDLQIKLEANPDSDSYESDYNTFMANGRFLLDQVNVLLDDFAGTGNNSYGQDFGRIEELRKSFENEVAQVLVYGEIYLDAYGTDEGYLAIHEQSMLLLYASLDIAANATAYMDVVGYEENLYAMNKINEETHETLKSDFPLPASTIDEEAALEFYREWFGIQISFAEIRAHIARVVDYFAGADEGVLAFEKDVTALLTTYTEKVELITFNLEGSQESIQQLNDEFDAESEQFQETWFSYANQIPGYQTGNNGGGDVSEQGYAIMQLMELSMELSQKADNLNATNMALFLKSNLMPKMSGTDITSISDVDVETLLEKARVLMKWLNELLDEQNKYAKVNGGDNQGKGGDTEERTQRPKLAVTANVAPKAKIQFENYKNIFEDQDPESQPAIYTLENFVRNHGDHLKSNLMQLGLGSDGQMAGEKQIAATLEKLNDLVGELRSLVQENVILNIVEEYNLGSEMTAYKDTLMGAKEQCIAAAKSQQNKGKCERKSDQAIRRIENAKSTSEMDEALEVIFSPSYHLVWCQDHVRSSSSQKEHGEYDNLYSARGSESIRRASFSCSYPDEGDVSGKHYYRSRTMSGFNRISISR